MKNKDQLLLEIDRAKMLLRNTYPPDNIDRVFEIIFQSLQYLAENYESKRIKQVNTEMGKKA